jgi:ArsR family transcriptional regulator
MLVTTSQPEALLTRLGNLADPTRLRLLCILERHELGVTELCDVLQLPQSTVSRHLKVLADQGWIHSRSHRTTNLYRMDGGDLDADALQLWGLARQQSEDWATLRQDELRAQRRLEQRGAQEFFASAAGDWDGLRDELYGSRFASQTWLAMLPAHWTIADLGCGTGLALADLSRCVAHVIGIDQSEAMLATARSRTAGLGNVELHQADLADLPVPDSICDAAQMVLALSYVPQPSAVLSSLARILKAGGRGVVIDLLRHDRDDFRREMGQTSMGFEPGELAQLLEQSGLGEVRVRALPPEPHARGPALLLADGVKVSRST